MDNDGNSLSRRDIVAGTGIAALAGTSALGANASAAEANAAAPVRAPAAAARRIRLATIRPSSTGRS